MMGSFTVQFVIDLLQILKILLYSFCEKNSKWDSFLAFITMSDILQNYGVSNVQFGMFLLFLYV